MSEDREVWRKVPGFPYEASNQGRVRNESTREVLATWESTTGYARVSLSINGKSKRFRVHHLVLKAFVGPRREGYQTNHKNGDKMDNRPDNLEWVTASENIAHAYANGLIGAHGQPGEKNANAQLNEDLVLEIRKRAVSGESYASISEDMPVGMQAVSRVARGKRWGHVGGPIQEPRLTVRNRGEK